MINLQVTAFHMDFSTLDMEKGQKAVLPFGINYTVQPITIEPLARVEGLTIEKKEQIQAERRVSARKRKILPEGEIPTSV